MKLLKFAGLAMALTLPMMLAGCDVENPEETAKDEADIDANTRAQLNKDDAELKDELAKAQAKDPSIKDMYYGVDDEGNKVVHVVREVKDEKTGQMQSHDSSMPMLQGMVLGMLMSNMMNNNYGNYSRQYGGSGNYSSRMYNSSESRSYRNQATSRYSASTRSVMQRSYVSSRPSSAYSTRSSGAFSSSSSARSGGYSAGG